MLFISLLVYIPLGIYCSSVSEDSSTSFTHPWNSIRGYLAATSTPIVPPIPRKDLPVGSDFKRIITENMIYIDKTDIIHRMITKEVYVFLSRPPRFGKSLLVSTLSYLFNGNSTNEKLFEGTKIKETFGSKKFPEYTVLRFDFAPVASSTLQAFNTSLRSKVGNFMIDYGTHKQGCVDKVDLKDCLEELLNGLWKKTGRQNVVLIDEYDHPWRNFRGKESDRPEMLEIMRDFFVVLKSSDKNMRFCFVTGSTKIALTEFFSGYNCATDISWFAEYETIVGFSENDLKTYFHEYVTYVAHRDRSKPDEVYQLLNEKFEGFRFSKQNAKMYNSQELVDFFKTESKDITTYRERTSSKYVIQIIQKMPSLTGALDLMSNLIEGKIMMIPVGVNFIRGFKDKFDDPLATLKVLYEGGILSIKDHKSFGMKEPDEYFIGFTNQVAQNHYHELVEEALKVRHFQLVTASDPGFKEPLLKRDIPDFLKRVEAHCMEVPYFLTPSDNITVTEALYQSVIFYGLRLSGFEPSWETILLTGRLDVRTSDKNTIFIFELKLKSNPEVPIMMPQCEGYSRAAQYRGKRVVCIGIVFHDVPTRSNEVVYGWSMFEKYSNASFVPESDNFQFHEFRTSLSEISDRLPAKKCQRCPNEDFPNESAFIQHLQIKHGSDHKFIMDNLVCPSCWKPKRNKGGLVVHSNACKMRQSFPN